MGLIDWDPLRLQRFRRYKSCVTLGFDALDWLTCGLTLSLCGSEELSILIPNWKFKKLEDNLLVTIKKYGHINKWSTTIKKARSSSESGNIFESFRLLSSYGCFHFMVNKMWLTTMTMINKMFPFLFEALMGLREI